jgi:hypothetical protein
MRIAGLLAVTVVLSSQPAVAVKRHASIPEPLRGSWAPSADACKNEDKSVVVLSAKAYTGSERSCSVLWVSETASVRGPTYSARLRCTNQLSQKRSESNLIIRPDNDSTMIAEIPAISSIHRVRASLRLLLMPQPRFARQIFQHPPIQNPAASEIGQGRCVRRRELDARTSARTGAQASRRQAGGSDAIDRNSRPATFRCAGRRPCRAPLPRDHPGRHTSRSIS